MAERGYAKDGTLWRSANEETVLVVGLRRSRDGRDCAVLLGVCVRQLCDKPRPRLSDCQLVFRFDRAVPSAWRSKALQHAAHVGDVAADPVRLQHKLDRKWEMLRAALLGHALPYLEKLASIEECRAEAARERIVKFFDPAVRQRVLSLRPAEKRAAAR